MDVHELDRTDVMYVSAGSLSVSAGKFWTKHPVNLMIPNMVKF
jgi:hypothetical protein